MIFIIESLISSYAIRRIAAATISPDTYSIRPWPNGCSESGFAPASLNPISVTAEDPASDRLLNASAVTAIEWLIVHDYGPGRQMVSLHAEVPAEGNILEIHDIIDNVENELKEKLGCDATIHMDPIVTSDEHVSEMKAAVISIIKGIDERINMHDFRVVTGPTHTNIIFDVLIPYKFQIQDDELAARITSQVRERLGNNYYVVIKVDHSYV